MAQRPFQRHQGEWANNCLSASEGLTTQEQLLQIGNRSGTAMEDRNAEKNEILWVDVIDEFDDYGHFCCGC